MESPGAPASPSPSTPSSGDEETFGTQFSASNASPVPKRRAVASGNSGGPSHRTRHNTGKQPTGSTATAGSALSLMGIGGTGASSLKDEVVDIAYMNELKALLETRFEPSITVAVQFPLTSSE
ncbi:hypothetical protein FRC04_003937 [Tulasnella sp. 424]|nr:hypothetical protein FRC04_003937 [Tulasnella sp. 424]